MTKKMNLNLTKPSFDREELEAVRKTLESGWVIRGPETSAFEAEFAKYMGAKYAIATNGCTMALYLVLKEMNLRSDDEVIVPSLTWSATASAVINAGAKPVFADVRNGDWCLDPEDVRRKITKKTRLVIPVHYAGRYARGYENFPVPVMYDNAHRVEKGDFKGTTSCYSFYAVKNMTTIRGGMILTDDPKKAEWYRKGVHGGLTKDTRARYEGAQKQNDASSFYYEVEFPGWNFDMTDIEAAVGRVQLRKLPKLNARRNEIVKKYNRAFNLKNTGNHLYPIVVPNRDDFLLKMKEAGIQCGIHYLPLHQMTAYKQYAKGAIPVTEKIGAHTVSIPLHAMLTDKEVNYVIKTANKILGGRGRKGGNLKGRRLPTVSVGITAYNEQKNIRRLLESLKNQEQAGFRLKEIIVISDGSIDLTVSEAKKVKSPYIRITREPERAGQQSRQNQILRFFKGDILVLLEADVLPKGNDYLAKLIRPLATSLDARVVMAVGDDTPVRPRSLYERMLYSGTQFKKRLAASWKGGNNIYSCGGHSGKALARHFAKSLRFPKAVPEDVYIYMALKKSGLRFVKTYEAVAYMRNVSNFRDRLKQARKYHSGKGSLENYFPPDSLKREYAIPRLQMFQTFVGFFLRKPVWIALYFFDVLLVRSLLWAGGRRKFQPLYEPYYSSKDLTA